MAPRLYVDEDPHQNLAINLRSLGQDAISTREAGNKGLSDARQPVFATEQNRAIITCNAKHFELLHEALVLWWRRFGSSGGAPHAGILIVPSGSLIDLVRTTQVVAEFVQRPESDALAGRLFEWQQRTGWQERHMP